MGYFAGKVISVTGAGSGIGHATAKMLLRRGALVSICDVNEAALKDTAELLNREVQDRSSTSNPILSSVVDVRDRTAVCAFFESTKAHFGRIDGCANVAGVRGHWANIWETSTEEYERIMDTNSKGVFNFLAEALRPGSLEAPGGSIVNITSTWGEKGLKRDAPYSASKHAINGLTRVAAKEAGPRGIRVNAVAPGAVLTPMLENPNANFASPLPRAAGPEEIAKVVCFLLSDESSYVTGAIYTVDGGATC